MDVAAIKNVFVENDVELTKEDVWKVQQAWVIKHAALERLAHKLGIGFEAPEVIQGPNTPNWDGTSFAILVHAFRKIGDKDFQEWSIGEVNSSNYRTSGKQPAYPWAMCEKRGKDRAIIKLAGLHGLYSEDEADDFKEQNKPQQQIEPQKPSRAKAEDPVKPVKLAVVKPDEAEPMPDYNHLDGEQRAVCDRVLGIEEIAQVSDYMMSPEVQAVLNDADQTDRTFIRTFAAKRLKALGWLGAGKAKTNADA